MPSDSLFLKSIELLLLRQTLSKMQKGRVRSQALLNDFLVLPRTAGQRQAKNATDQVPASNRIVDLLLQQLHTIHCSRSTQVERSQGKKTACEPNGKENKNKLGPTYPTNNDDCHDRKRFRELIDEYSVFYAFYLLLDRL